ncbi:FAD dependent oxidoreductase-domain-containing protein [Whalleya microplaca]|nr:FAD dependent oxidoreductase-domain-containing protein [Whalleya microplaca]
MGAVQSTFKTLWLAIKVLLAANKDIQAILQRASQPPGLPVPNPTKSYWLADPPFPELVDKQSPTLPPDADIVIIGSGITGAAVARTVLQERERKGVKSSGKVVVLEARSLCSGATGRNGGHIKSSPHELFARLRGTLGAARAAALTRFQLAHVGVLTKLCAAEGWDVAECREVETVDFYLDEADREKAFKEVRELAEYVPELEIQMWDAGGAQKKFEVNQYIKGAISYTAGALWPFRFVSSVWKDLFAKYEKSLCLETGTAVQSIVTTKQQGRAYEVVTSRGTIKCDYVVHATNSFATQFVPGLRGKMTGFLAHMSAQRPGKQFPDLDGSRSWSVIYGSAFDYVTQRPTVNGRPGDIMLGGGFSRSRNDGLSSIGIWDDSKMDALPIAHISGIFPTIFEPHWGNEAEGGRTKQTWSGIVAATGDLLPFVGRLDPELTGRSPGTRRKDSEDVHPGEWISAGYCGDGMVWAWLSGTALGLMLTGSDQEQTLKVPGRPGGRLEDWFPHELTPTLQRVKRASLESLADLFL